jgi:purine-binding chemotaxis protein CheW
MSNSQLEQILSQRQMYQQAIIDVDEPVIKLVIFSLDEQHFAFAGDAVKEVLPGTEAVFFVPGMPDSVEGVMNVRGDIESLIQLHTLLQLPNIREKSALHLTSILLARGKQMRSGLRVDRLLDVVDIPQSQVQPAPDALPEYLQTYVTGLLQFSGLAVAVLDIDALFSAWQKGQG